MFIQRYCVYALPTEHAQLEQVARQGTTPQKVARRARMVLMLSHHASPSAVARTLHVSRMTVRLWANRVVTDGVPGVLRDASRPGRRKQLSPANVQAIVDATLTTRPPAGTHWRSRSLAKAQDVSDGTIRKIWAAARAPAPSGRALQTVDGPPRCRATARRGRTVRESARESRGVLRR